MEANEKIALFNEVTTQESSTVSGGANVNFDLDSYLFRIGAGAIFDGGLTTNVINLAFQGAIFTSTGSGTSSAAAPAAPAPTLPGFTTGIIPGI